MSQQNTIGTLPTAIAHKLRSVQRRQIALTTTRGVAIGLGVLLIGMVIAMTIDWLFLLLSPMARTSLTTATLATGLVAVVMAVATPIRNVWSLRQAARTVDSNVPHLQERWTTVATLSNTSGRTQSTEQQLMQEQVSSEAVAMHSLVHPAKITPVSMLKKPLLGLALCAAVLAGFMAIYPQQTSILWQRFWSPTQDITATVLSDPNEINLVPRGEMIELTFLQDGVQRDEAQLTIQYPSGFEESETVNVDGDNKEQFVHALRADESFQFRMTAGDGRTNWHALQVIDYPEIAEVKFRIIAPEYVDRDDVEKGFIPRRIKVIQGTRLVMAIKPKESIDRLQIATTTQAESKANGDKPEPQTNSLDLVADSDGWYQFEQLLTQDVMIEPTLYSEHGLKNESRSICRIETIPDAAPIARVISPTDEVAVANDEVIEIEFEAHDDHGIAKAELVIYDDSRKDENGDSVVLERREIPLGDQKMAKHLQGSTLLDLKDFALGKDAEISYAIRVTDNHDAASVPADDMHDDGERIASKSYKSTAKDSSSKESRSPQDSDLESQMQASKDPMPQSESADGKSMQPSDEDLVSKDGKSSSKHATDEAMNREMLAGNQLPRDQNQNGKNDTKPSGNPNNKLAMNDDEKDRKSSGGSKNAKANKNQPNPNSLAAAGNQPKKNPANEKKPQADAKPPNEMPNAMASIRPRTRGGQNVETKRRRLKITERLAAIAKSDAKERMAPGDTSIRERVVKIDEQLKISQVALKALVDHSLPDSTRGEKFKELDAQMGTIEKVIAELREETKEGQFAFVGLQMVDIGRFHLTPARDRVFASIRRPGASDLDAKVALGQVNRARSRLEKLLKRYDRVKQDRDLKKELDEKIPMYEVYVEKSQQLLREARQNRNPLTRKMSVINVDQDYLDQYANNLKLRREMLKEFSEMLANDPRLLSRYMDLTRRRNNTMRARLTTLTERQDEMTYELLGWIEIDEQQRDDLWNVIVELRIGTAEQLADDINDLTERIVRQMPLSADPTRGTPQQIVRVAESMTAIANNLVGDSESLLEELTPEQIDVIKKHGDELVNLSELIEALLDQLQVEQDGVEEFTDYVQPRLLETRIVGAQCDSWAAKLNSLVAKKYAPIAALEQHGLAADTQQLRMDMQSIQTELETEFQRQDGAEVPAEVIALVNELHHLMESISMNQVAAVIAAKNDDLERTAAQQQLALDRMDEAEKLFDKMRRAVVTALDTYQERDPNIADLRDPTLDEFLARLEREANIAAELGIPGRRRNLRVIADSMLWQQQAQGLLGNSGEQAAMRARLAAETKRKGQQRDPDAEKKNEKPDNKPMSEEDKKKLAESKRQQKELEQTLLKVEAQSKSADVSPEQKQRLEALAKDLREMMNSDGGDKSQSDAWQRMVDSDKAEQMLKAIARGESIPTDQWNKLFSTLEDGLWQVRGKKPPEEYRKAIRQYQDSLRQLVGQNDDA